MPDSTTPARSTVAPTVGEEAPLARAFGALGLAAGIVNVTVGGGIFRLPATVAASLGAAAPLAYLVCAVVMALIVLCFAEAGSRVALTGGPYAYVEIAFGPFVGFMAGVLLWLLGTSAVAAVATVLADTLAGLAHLPTGPGAAPTRAAMLLVVLALLGGVNIAGVRQGARLNAVATAAKLVPLLLLVAVGAAAIDPARLHVATMPSAASLGRTAIVLVFAFSGVESALVPSGEVRDPARTVPRAVFGAMVAITALYIALQVVAQGVLGARLASEPTPLAAVAGVALGGWGRTLLLVGAAVSMLGYVSGMTLAVPRALYAFGRDGFLPRVFARVHPTRRTPYVAIAAQALAVWLLAASGTFEPLAIVANGAALLLYAACAAAAWELRRRDVRSGGTPFRLPPAIAAVVPPLALVAIAALLTSVKANEWAAILAVLAVATLAYVVTRGRRARGATLPDAA